MGDLRERIYKDINDERARQDLKWGKQVHPFGMSATNKPLADSARNSCRRADVNGTKTWFHIAREEFYEMSSEIDYPKMRIEAIQLIAVLVAMVESGDELTQ